MGEHDHAVAAGQRTLALATTSGAFDIQVVAQTTLGQVYYAGGDFRQALDVLRQVMALLTGERRSCALWRASLPAVSSRGYVAECLTELGGFAEGRDVAEDAVRLAEAVEQPFSIAAALLVCWFGLPPPRGRPPAIPVLERSLALCQTANILRFVPMVPPS